MDTDIKKQFKETEDKVKDLPDEILQRHKDFVKHYDDNLNELNTDLNAIDKAKTEAETNAEIEKTKAFLEKVKPPKKHTPLDPNNLPHRTAEPVFVEPRLNPEEFEKDSSQESVARSQNNIKISPNPSLQKRGTEVALKSYPTLEKGGKGGFDKPLLVASNGSLDGILKHTSNPVIPLEKGIQASGYPIETFGYDKESIGTSASPNLLLALATPPTSADLAQTIEVQFTPEITAKAEELQHNPVKIYNWVRNNIEFVPIHGSIQGANMCLQTKLCNAFDTSSLLIALLRVSGISAKYVQGTVEIPTEKVKNWVGGFTDTMSALNLLASAGIPTAGQVVGGEIKYVRIEHVWVEAYVDYIPSRGEIHKQGDTWIPLDASFKQYNYTQGIDIKSAVPFDAQSFVNQIQSTATINESEGYITSVNSSFINQTMADYQTQVQNYITQTYPNATVGDVLGKKEIIKQEFPHFLGTLPYHVIVKGAHYSSIPDNLRHRITFNVTKDIYDELLGTPLNTTKSLPALAGKKITLSFSPATLADEAIINKYLPKPHADGTPIDPSELPTSLSAYLINVKPEIRVDGQVIATGSAVGLGINETFTMSFSGPGANARDVITNDIKSGNYYGIAFDLGRISQEQMEALKTKLASTKAKLEAQNFTGLTKDDILGDLLYTTALSYHAEFGVMNQVSANTMGLVAITYPSETIFSSELKSNYYYGIPVSVSPNGLAMDADRLITLVKSLDGDAEKPKQFMLNAGTNGSALEHSVPEQLWSTTENPGEGISAVKAIKIANDQGIPIYTINKSNINTILPQLQIETAEKDWH
ncbi:MAG: transglutaminase domain-containing protein [Nitrospirae bacterium]|nr:transglutaminase domain-containing protein [Nitrospirota bacterium]